MKVLENHNDGSFKGRPKGTPYYTVINMNLNVHRHYDDKNSAMSAARHCDKIDIPKKFGVKFKRDIMYLLTGDDSVYGDYYINRDRKGEKADG